MYIPYKTSGQIVRQMGDLDLFSKVTEVARGEFVILITLFLLFVSLSYQ